MKILQTKSKIRARMASFGFTLVETLAAIVVATTVLSTHYLGLAAGFAIVNVTREDLRASQIMLKTMEAIRLSGYSQLTDPTKFPTNFWAYYSEKDKTNGHGGAAYAVTYTAAAGPTTLPPSYRGNVLKVTVGVTWDSGKVTRNRSMDSFVSRHGVQSYISGN